MRVLIPNSTQVPDILLDHWMAELSGSEFKVLLYIARRTYGFGKEWDTISLKQISNGIKKRDGTILDHGTGVSRASVVRALNVLEAKGIIIKQLNQRDDSREYEENTYSINLAWEMPKKKSGGGSQGGESGEGNTTKRISQGVVSKRDYLVSKQNHPVSNVEPRWSQNETRVVSKRDLQETDLQETAATLSEPHADAELMARLVAEGVGRTVAMDLARLNPEACKQQLDYLPFAEVRKSKGAWLANAIRHGYGPPEKYLQRQSQRKAATASQSSSCVAQESHHAKRIKQGRLTYAQLERSKPETIRAFDEHLQTQKHRATQFSLNLSDSTRTEFLAHLESENYRLEQFAKWAEGEGAHLLQNADP
jgi:DNA-binding MarR family transcriptional regulator